jgi:hypothetical protein
MPVGTEDSVDNPSGQNDIALAESPVEYPGAVTGGNAFTFAATGTTTYQPGYGPYPAAGDSSLVTSRAYLINNGIVDLTAPASALVGVFLGPCAPTSTALPAALNYADTANQTPALQQPFYIGSGRNGSGDVQLFIAPPYATRLFLGTMDGFGWWNNLGQLVVSITNQPCSSPNLHFTRGNTSGTLSYNYWALGTNYVLQSATNLALADWLLLTNGVPVMMVTNGVPVISVTVTINLPAQFFRLHLPTN